jgi:translation elongation factor EF-4
MINQKNNTEQRCSLVYNIPLAEVVTDYFDEMKSRSRGYASMEYAITGYRVNDLVRMDIKVNQDTVDPLALICHRDTAYR